MLGRNRKAKRKPDDGHSALVSMSSHRAYQQARERREGTAAGARRVIEAASRPDPSELLPATPAEVAALEDTAVGRAFGVVAGSARISRDGLTCVFILGDGEGGKS